MVPNLVKRLRTVIGGNGKAECMVGSVPDPFVQVKMLQLLCLLCEDDGTAAEDVIDVISLVYSLSIKLIVDLFEGRQQLCRLDCRTV